MRNRTYGGVRGRKTKVGRKLLRFPPTQFSHANHADAAILANEAALVDNAVLADNVALVDAFPFADAAFVGSSDKSC